METTWPAEIRLGALLLREGLVTAEQLEKALAEQLRVRRRLGEILVERGWVSHGAVARALAEQYGLDYVDLAGREIEPGLPSARTGLAALPLRRLADGRVELAIADPTDAALRHELDSAFEQGVRLVVADEGELDRRLEKLAHSTVVA